VDRLVWFDLTGEPSVTIALGKKTKGWLRARKKGRFDQATNSGWEDPAYG
jgi:hypothetical protein